MIRKLVCFCALFWVMSIVYCQNLAIEGRVYMDIYEQYSRENDTIYFAPMGKEFNKQSFILANENDTFTFSIPLSKIIKEKIETIVFTQQIDASSIEDFACTHKVHIGKALKEKKLSDKKNPKIITDLLLLEHCCERSMREISEKEATYTGNYKFEGDRAIKTITLNSWYGCTLTYPHMHDNLMIGESGSWKFDEAGNKIMLSTWQQQNPELGIVILTNKKYSFDISNEAGVVELKVSD